MDWQNFRLQRRLSLSSETIETVYKILSEIDSVKYSWEFTSKISPQTLSNLTKSVIITSTGASNRLEGNKLSDQEVENLYKNLHIVKFQTRDEQEIAGYLACLGLIFENYMSISINESWILKLHHDMLIHSTKDEPHKGNYKFGSNRVEAKDADGKIVGVIFDPTPPYLVKKEMQELIDWYTWATKSKAKHPLILIANFIFEYLAIHPFQDGNGRTSRLLTNLMLLQHDYLFAKVVSHERLIEKDKIDYYRALNNTQTSWKTDKEHITPWLLFFLGIIKEQSQKTLLLLKEDADDHLLSEKQLALWQWARTLQGAEFTRKAAVEALGFPTRTVEHSIKKLLDLKKIKRLGEGKATRYRPF